jgi:hypothetical protein
MTFRPPYTPALVSLQRPVAVPGVNLGVRRGSGRPRGWEKLRFAKENGAGARTRTEDLLITNQLLYQLSYAGTA